MKIITFYLRRIINVQVYYNRILVLFYPSKYMSKFITILVIKMASKYINVFVKNTLIVLFITQQNDYNEILLFPMKLNNYRIRI